MIHFVVQIDHNDMRHCVQLVRFRDCCRFPSMQCSDGTQRWRHFIASVRSMRSGRLLMYSRQKTWYGRRDHEDYVRKTTFTFSFLVALTFHHFISNLLPPVTRVQCPVSTIFEISTLPTALRFGVNRRHGTTDGQTDRQSATLNAASQGQPHNNT